MEKQIIKHVECDNCGAEIIYACVGTSECYVCKKCFSKIETGELTITAIEETRALRRKS